MASVQNTMKAWRWRHAKLVKEGDAAAVNFRATYETFHSVNSLLRLRNAAFGDLLIGRYVARPGYTVWRRHGHEDWAMLYSVSGRGRFGPPPNPSVIPPHHVLLIPPGVPWDYGIADGRRQWDLFGVIFRPRPEWHPMLSRWPAMGHGALAIALTGAALCRRIFSRLEDALRIARGRNPQRRAMVLNAVEEVLLWCDAENSQRGPAAIDPRVRRVMEQIDRHPEANISMEDLAGQVGVSVSRLCHMFRRHLRIPPREFLEQRRLERARELLDHSDLSIGEIAETVGFGDAFYFSRRFRRALDMSPREYRQRLRRGHRGIET